ncbi:MAG: alpha-amylase family glycosyl hydrolase, partial [Bacteroidota bacterium]
SGEWTKTVRLRVGGHVGGGVPGAYQYKYNINGNSSGWLSDPLNHRLNASDNNNSILYIGNPTIFQLVPNQRTGIVREGNPVISAYLFPVVGGEVDADSITVTVGTSVYTNLGSFYDPTTRKFAFQVPDRVPNGTHTVYLTAGANTDSVTITVQAGFIQITNLGSFSTRNPLRTIYGIVEDTSITTVTLVQNETDSTEVPVVSGRYSSVVTLVEGLNTFKAVVVVDSVDTTRVSDPVTFTYVVSHAPTAVVTFSPSGDDVVFDASQSTDPDSTQVGDLTFLWKEDPANPVPIAGVDGSVLGNFAVPKPTVPGDYAFWLVVTDPDNNKDTTRNYFTITGDGNVRVVSNATIPDWARYGRMYELFFKSLTPAGTINAALPYLDYFKSLGVNILWVMPVMENAYPINNGPGPGYNIKNLYKVAPEYGTNEDFRNFVQEAHARGLKVILDVTPNHTSFAHPFVVESRLFRENSPYWNFYQHTIIPHNDNGLGQSLTPDGFNYYTGFSDQLLNYNWNDIDAHHYMTEVYSWWVEEMGLDGYRYDVYWGPRRRYGENTVGAQLRKA